MEAMLMMFPFDRISSGSAYLEQRKTVVRLPSMVFCQSSSVQSAARVRERMIPALFTRTSSWPKVSIAARIRRWMSAPCVTSAGTASARPPAESISLATASIGPGRRPLATTLAPSRANMRAMARPRPVPPPVTIATLFFNRMSAQSLLKEEASVLAQGHHTARMKSLSRAGRGATASNGAPRLADVKSGEGWSGVCRRLLACQRRSAPALEHRELGDCLACELRKSLRGLAERHDRRDGDMAGNAQKLLQLRLLRHCLRRDGSAVPFVTGGQQDVPRERIDRPSADDADSLQILIEGCNQPEVHADD